MPTFQETLMPQIEEADAQVVAYTSSPKEHFATAAVFQLMSQLSANLAQAVTACELANHKEPMDTSKHWYLKGNADGLLSVKKVVDAYLVDIRAQHLAEVGVSAQVPKPNSPQEE